MNAEFGMRIAESKAQKGQENRDSTVLIGSFSSGE